jgi:hypothetical protein
VTHLRKILREELQRRHYSEATTQRYIRLVERLAQHFHCSPDRLGTRHIREHQAQLFTVHFAGEAEIEGYYTQWNSQSEVNVWGYEIAYYDDGRYFRCDGRVMPGSVEILAAKK